MDVEKSLRPSSFCGTSIIGVTVKNLLRIGTAVFKELPIDIENNNCYIASTKNRQLHGLFKEPIFALQEGNLTMGIRAKTKARLLSHTLLKTIYRLALLFRNMLTGSTYLTVPLILYSLNFNLLRTLLPTIGRLPSFADRS